MCWREPAIQSMLFTLWCTACRRQSSGTSWYARCVKYCTRSATSTIKNSATQKLSPATQARMPSLAAQPKNLCTIRLVASRMKPNTMWLTMKWRRSVCHSGLNTGWFLRSGNSFSMKMKISDEPSKSRMNQSSPM